MSKTNLKILIVSSECAPLAKTGGLADVVGALPKELKALGHEVRVMIPWYRQQVSAAGVSAAGGGKSYRLSTPLGGQGLKENFSLGSAVLPGTDITVTLVDQPDYFDRDSLYGSSKGDFEDNAERYIFFCQAVLQTLRELEFKPDIIHCNDWHTALIPVYIKTLLAGEFKDMASLMTIHNLAYQGLFGKELFEKTGLSWDLFNTGGLEFYDQVNFLKGGLIFADKINTVSKRYSKEIQTPEFGCGLEGVLLDRAADLSGIVNGLDYGVWSPQTDSHLAVKFSAKNLEKKEEQKKVFLSDQGLVYDPQRPLLGMVSRLDGMKGLSLLEEIMDYLLELDVHLAILGTGDEHFENFLAKVHERYPDKTTIHLTFSNRLAHQIEASSDIFLMPSRFEPCGLNQLISLRYGTLPVVRATGGLADTIEDYEEGADKGTGFVFAEYASMPFFTTIRRAVELYRQDRESWKKMQKRAMAADFSWLVSAEAYVALYQSALKSSAK